MDHSMSQGADRTYQPAYVRALKTWNALAGVVIVAIWAEACLTNTLTKYLSFAAPIFGPGFMLTAAFVHFQPRYARVGANIGFLFFSGYFLLAYIFALVDGPWEYSYLIFSNAVWTSTIYLYASLFLGRSAFRVNLANAAITSVLTIACSARFLMADFPSRQEQFGLQPYFYSLLAQWAMLIGAQAVNELYRAVRSSEQQVAFLRQVVAEMVGHEIGTPLQSMVNNLGLIHVLIRRIPGASASPDVLAKADKAIGNLQRSVEQIERVLANAADSSTSSVEETPSAHIDEVDLPHLLDSIIEDFRARAAALSLDLQHDRSASCPYKVSIDRTRVTQIVTNLVSNALKYTDSGGVVLRCSSLRKNELQISVVDTGIGIPAEALTSIFEPYVRLPEAKKRETPGSGLGLAVVKRELAVLNGHISVESVHGQGSSFTVTIPAEVASFASSPSVTRPRILIVDDSAESLGLALELLGTTEFECSAAADGGKAIEMLATHSFDLVFLDVQMPVADGYQVAKQIRTDPALMRNAGVPIVGMSASIPKDGDSDLFNFFLKKPFTFSAELARSFLVVHAHHDVMPTAP